MTFLNLFSPGNRKWLQPVLLVPSAEAVSVLFSWEKLSFCHLCVTTSQDQPPTHCPKIRVFCFVLFRYLNLQSSVLDIASERGKMRNAISGLDKAKLSEEMDP